MLTEILKEMGRRENLAVLVPDQYANYVVQTAIVLAEPENFKVHYAHMYLRLTHRRASTYTNHMCIPAPRTRTHLMRTDPRCAAAPAPDGGAQHAARQAHPQQDPQDAAPARSHKRRVLRDSYLPRHQPLYVSCARDTHNNTRRAHTRHAEIQAPTLALLASGR